MQCNFDEHMKRLVDRFQWYVNDFEDSKEALDLKRQYLLTAKQYVEQYLNFSLDIHDVTEEHIYVNSRDIPLKDTPTQEVYSVFYGGKQIPPMFYTLMGDTLHLNHHGCSYQDDFPLREGMKILVNYCAGYREIPELIEMTILRLAALLKSEANGDIALTSKSYGSDGSRSFYNYQNWDKFMAPLAPLRTTRLT